MIDACLPFTLCCGPGQCWGSGCGTFQTFPGSVETVCTAWLLIWNTIVCGSCGMINYVARKPFPNIYTSIPSQTLKGTINTLLYVYVGVYILMNRVYLCELLRSSMKLCWHGVYWWWLWTVPRLQNNLVTRKKRFAYPYEEEDVLKNGCSACVLYPSNQSGTYVIKSIRSFVERPGENTNMCWHSFNVTLLSLGRI